MFKGSEESKQMGRGESMDKVGELWSQKATAEDMERRKMVSWMEHSFILNQCINKKISGNPEVNWFIYIKNKYIPKKLKFGLNLGCGDGCLERHAFRLDICEKFDAFDIAEGGIEIARNKARQERIGENVNYEVRDINNIHLEKEKYDIVFTSMSAHHFKELEHIFKEIKKSLKPSGLFVLNEFIGPSQFQWTDKQLKIINNLLEILPSKYREYVSMDGKIKERAERCSLEYMNEHDPSEAIRSAEIIPLLNKHFNIIEKVDYGGTLLHMLFADIVGNFNERKEEDMVLLKLLYYFEEVLIQEKALPSDFALIVAQKKKAFISEKFVWR